MLAFLSGQPRGSATPTRCSKHCGRSSTPFKGLTRCTRPSTPAACHRSGYRAGISAEYVHYDTEVVWLDPELVDARSWHCRRLLAQRPETERLVEALVANYRGRFAADFAYEDWASAYRDSLHAGYLAVVERAVGGAVGSSGLRWRLWVGQQALAVDPEADVIEAHVIRLYRELGAPAAAAEQYAHTQPC